MKILICLHDYLPLHSPRFDVDEHVLKIGSAFFDRVARESIKGTP